jgi:hypothetical protein
MPPAFTDHGTITVTITNNQHHGPVIKVNKPNYNPKGAMNGSGKANWGPGVEGEIKWELANGSNPNWGLGCIEFEGEGVDEFEEHGQKAQSNQAASKSEIFLINKFTKKGSYKYTIWAVPRHGYGKPISLDPMIENEPEYS